MRRLATCLAFVILSGCASSGLAGAEGDFKAGRLPDAKAKLVALEPESAAWSASRRAEYALYRGLVHHALGDREVARRWLGEAKALDQAQPNSLSEDDRLRLGLALDALGR